MEQGPLEAVQEQAEVEWAGTVLAQGQVVIVFVLAAGIKLLISRGYRVIP